MSKCNSCHCIDFCLNFFEPYEHIGWKKIFNLLYIKIHLNWYWNIDISELFIHIYKHITWFIVSGVFQPYNDSDYHSTLEFPRGPRKLTLLHFPGKSNKGGMVVFFLLSLIKGNMKQPIRRHIEQKVHVLPFIFWSFYYSNKTAEH